MADILALLVPLTALYIPIYVIKRKYDLREREKRLASAPDARELEGLREERKLLQERIENLESIVCSVDHELNLRLARLTSESRADELASRREQASAGGIGAAGEVAGGVAADAAAAGAPALARESTAAASPRAGGVAVASTAMEVRGQAALAARDVPAESFAPGALVGDRYRIERLLGRGGMGAVYLAHDDVLGELVALKLISSSWTHDPDAAIARFRREASAARRVSSPNVIRIHDLGETRGGLLYISMEYVAARTLADLLDSRGTLDAEGARDIVGQICDGLESAHDAGVVHRDLKPQNVLVGERNAVKIIDFGLAKTTFLGGMTATGLILGTPQYMSPEQVKGRPVDARTDIYSLGALTYHAVTGRPPFEGDTPIAVGFATCSETPRPPRELRPEMSQKLSDTILAALAKEPSERPQTAGAFRRAL